MTDRLRESKGCFKESLKPIHRIGEALSFTSCIGNFFDESAISLLRMHRVYETGSMPYPGALAEQPSKVIEAFSVIDTHRSDRQEEEAKKQRLAAKGGRRGR